MTNCFKRKSKKLAPNGGILIFNYYAIFPVITRLVSPSNQWWIFFIFGSMRAFLSYRFKDEVSIILDLLKRKEIEIIDAYNLAIGESFQLAIKTAIKTCDFVVLLYTSANTNIAFEAGVAMALNKPIFTIISPDELDEDFLIESTYVHALPSEREKIEFNFEVFFDKIVSKRNRSYLAKFDKKVSTSDNLIVPILYEGIFQNFTKLNKKSEKEFELFFVELFKLYKLEIIKNKFESNHDFYADFCIWSDPLSSLLGNPILIEVKTVITKEAMVKLSRSFSELIRNRTVSTCLIFYDRLNGIHKNDLPNTETCLYIQISDLLESLKFCDFNESIKKLRNEIVHYR